LRHDLEQAHEHLRLAAAADPTALDRARNDRLLAPLLR
jgi:hypothetical protein